MKNQILEIFKAYERETEWEGNAIPESMYDAMADDIMKLYDQKKRIAILGGGFQGVICGIGKARTLFLEHENIVRYPVLPLTVDEPPKEVYMNKIKLEFPPEVIENFERSCKALAQKAKEVTELFESIGQKMDNPLFHEKKKHKGHERPYKYHR